MEVTPAGTYTATFKARLPLVTKNGKCWRWEFTGDNGRVFSALSDAEKPPTTGNKTGRWLCALATKPLVAGTQVDPDSHIGKKYMLIYISDDKLGTFTAV